MNRVGGGVGKFLVHRELAAGEPDAADAGQRGERLHLRTRPRWRRGGNCRRTYLDFCQSYLPKIVQACET